MEKQQYVDLEYHDTKLRLHTQTQNVDLYTISEGRDIESGDELVLTYNYAKANSIAVGDKLKLAGREFTVCGLGMKSDYAIMLYDLSETIPNKSGFGIGIITQETMEELGTPMEFYSVRYRDPEQERAFRVELYQNYGTQEYVEKEANSRICLIYNEADDLVAEFTLYAPIIMVVVIAVIAMVLTRTVRREGKTIGTLMALGYRKKELIRHYMVYGMIPAFAGDVLGILFSIPFAKAFCSFYFGDAEHITYVVKMPWNWMVAALFIPVLVYGMVSWLVLNRVLQSDITPLLTGVQKQKKSRIFNGSNAKLPVIYSIRSLTINGFRCLTFVIGIAIATLCIVLGGSFEDAYDHLLKVKVPDAMLGGQYEYGFQSFQTENPYGGAAVFDISFGAKKDNSRFNMIGYEPDNGILNTQTVEGAELEYGKYYMTSAAANKYGVAKGDSFCFYNTVTMQETTVTISGIVKSDILPLVLTSKENVAQLLNRPLEEYNAIIGKEKLTIPNGLLKKNASLQDYEEQVRNLSATAGIVLKLLKVLGMLICLLIVTMMSGFIIGESSRNISMLEVLGYRKGEVRRFVLTVNHFLVPVGFILGVPLGYLVAYSMILSAAQSSGRLMSLPVRPATLLRSFFFVLAAYGIAMALAGRKLKKVDMVETLKCPNE